MKMLIYLVLIIGFLMFYNSNPTMAIIIVLIAAGLFLFFRARKKGSTFRSTFFSSKGSQESNSKVDDLANLFMLQSLMNSNSRIYSNKSYSFEKRKNEKESEIDKTKQEVLAMLDEW